MKESINDKVKELQDGAENQAEFMKKLAEVDEEGQLTDDMLEQISGGAGIGKVGPLTDIGTTGMTTPQDPPFMTTTKF